MLTKTYGRLFIPALFVIAKTGNKQNSLQWLIHAMEYYSAIKLLKHATAWMGHKDITLGDGRGDLKRSHTV